MSVTEADKQALEWYWNRANHGRGQITAETRRLIQAGLLQVRATSRYEWMASLTPKGQNLLIERMVNPWWVRARNELAKGTL